MSVAYKPVGWNRTKLVYDGLLLAGVVGYIVVYLTLGPLLSERAAKIDAPILRMRAFGSCSFLLLTMILAIGPLARLDSRFLPLLYNRRHFGVIAAVVAVTHAVAVLDWYFAFSPTPQLVALFTANTSVDRISGFPFEWLGVIGLLILVVMAVTSHDFWLSFLTPPVWKSLHMAVYGAYAAIVLHVALGPLATGRSPVLTATVIASLTLLTTLHLLAGRRERLRDLQPAKAEDGTPWVDMGDLADLADLADGRAIVGAAAGGERIAVFRFKGGLSAISNVCSHQNGPVGEGKVVRGLITCPWHGYQYRLEDGCSPPPFKERIHKYRVRLVGTRIQVDPTPLPLGTRLDALPIPPLPNAPEANPPSPQPAAARAATTPASGGRSADEVPS